MGGNLQRSVVLEVSADVFMCNAGSIDIFAKAMQMKPAMSHFLSMQRRARKICSYSETVRNSSVSFFTLSCRSDHRLTHGSFLCARGSIWH